MPYINPDNPKECRQFVERVARMTRFGDTETDENGAEYPYQPDGCSDADAQALYGLIDAARILVASLEQNL